jgi:hypothetical protein
MSEYKALLLSMPFGTAANRLRKALMFRMMQRLEEDTCFRCGNRIETETDLSIEHKEPWQSASDPSVSFFDLGNIAFSHLRCNSGAGGGSNKKWSSDHERWNASHLRMRQDNVRHAAENDRRRRRYASGANPNRAAAIPPWPSG